MAAYNNGAGMIITKTSKKNFTIELNDNIKIYEPFFRLDHLGLNGSRNFYKGTYSSKIKHDNLIRFSQTIALYIKNKNDDKPKDLYNFKIFKIEPLEIISLAYLLPTEKIKDLISNIYALNNKTTISWNSTLSGSIPAGLFSNIIFFYLKNKDNFHEGDCIYCSPSWDIMRWYKGKFIALSFESKEIEQIYYLSNIFRYLKQ